MRAPTGEERLAPEKAGQAFVPKGQILPQGQLICPEEDEKGLPKKAAAFFGPFITCCEDDRLGELAEGKVFHIHEGTLR